MADERPQNPPPSVPIRGFTTPVNQEGFFSERVDYTAPEYRIVPRGTKYSTIVGADPNVVDQFAELYFLRETREASAYPWATRFWATDTLAEDSYNSAVEYVSEAVSFPAFTRSYTVRRDSYEANNTLAIGSPLTSLIGVKVIDGGQDYTFATVTITGTGSGATAEALIDTDGTIASIIVTNCGTGYTAAPAIDIVGDGGGAEAIGIIQPQSAVLVSQKKTEFPDEKLSTGGQAYMHPLKNEYVIVTRIYETLPGPWVYSQKEDTDGGLLTVKTRRNISANITVAETLVSTLWSDTTKKGVDDFVAEETVESRSIAIDNTTANAATRMTTSRVDEDGKTVTVIRLQASAAYLASIDPREVVSSGIWGRITSEPITHLKVWFIGESREIPGNILSTEKLDEDGVPIGIFKTMVTLAAFNAITPRETSSSPGFWTRYTCEPISDLVVWKSQESRALPGNAMVTTKIDEDGATITFTKTLDDTSLITSSETANTGFWVRTYKEEVSDLVAHKVIESRVLPGNAIPYTRIDDDGKVVSCTRTLKRSSLITTAETLIANVWTHTFKKEVSDLVSWEITETRAIPGNEMVSTKIDEDGSTITITKTLKDTSAITSSETANTGFWVRAHKEEVSDLVAYEVVESQPLPGNAIIYTRIDEDSRIISGSRTLKRSSTITTDETLSGGTWTHAFKKELSDLVSWEITESRPIPGRQLESTKVDEDGVEIQTVTILEDVSAITTEETLAFGLWTRVYQEAVSALVAKKIRVRRDIPGNEIISTVFERDGVTKTVSKKLVATSAVVFSEVLATGILTRKYGEAVTELVSHQIVDEITVDSDSLLDLPAFSVSIPENIIPLEFRAFIPTTIESHILEGTAAMPTLGAQEFEHSQKQLTPLYFEERITTLGDVSLPITQTGYQTTEGYGGGTIAIIRTLDVTGLTVDEGFSYVGSKVDPLGNGLDFKETRQFTLVDAAYPIDEGTHVDEKYGIVIGISKQVVAEGTVGGIALDGSYVEIKPHDVWRSISIASKLDESSLPDPVTWYSGQRHSFPPELQNDAIIDFAEGTCGCSESFSAVLIANMKQYTGNVKTRITEQFYNGAPPDDVTITQFFPETHNFGFAWASACGTVDGDCRTKSGAPNFHIPLCLHGDLTLCVGGVLCVGAPYTWTFLATSPDVLPHSTYIMLPPHIERWRFGVFRRVLTEVLVP